MQMRGTQTAACWIVNPTTVILSNTGLNKLFYLSYVNLIVMLNSFV